MLRIQNNCLTPDKELEILICETPSEVIVYQQELLTSNSGPLLALPVDIKMSRCKVA